MTQTYDIAVIGATGTVGETLVQILEERDFPLGTLHLLASNESAGSSVNYRGKNLRVREVDAFDFSQAIDSQSLPVQLVSPSAAAVALAVVLAPLKHLLELERVNVTACMAVSAQGREAVGELARQTAELLNARPLEPRFFDRQVAFNLLAQVGTSDSEGHGALERRL
uniref:Semialdhyde_dh domain-containing protein n=1 Tax=Steinernema glaseri TaxID=37863 RepID=A0A1I8ALY4_9BILA